MLSYNTSPGSWIIIIITTSRNSNAFSFSPFTTLHPSFATLSLSSLSALSFASFSTLFFSLHSPQIFLHAPVHHLEDSFDTRRPSHLLPSALFAHNVCYFSLFFPQAGFLVYTERNTNSIEIFSWVKQPVSFVFTAPQMWQHTSSAEPSSPSQRCPLCWQPLLLSSWPAPFFSTSWKETAELIHSETHRLLRKAPRATSVLPFSSSWPWPQQLVWLAEHWSPSIFVCIPPPSPWWPAPASSGVSVHHRGTTPVLPTARQRWRTWNGIHKVLFVIFTYSSRFKPYLSKTNVNPSIRIVRCNQQSERQILFH